MPRTITFALAAAAICLFASSQTMSQAPTRINFARGSTSALVTGRLSGYEEQRSFVLRVRSGQTIRTWQLGDSGPITIAIADPDGNDVGDMDASCNNRREVSPTKAGDYVLTVVECRKADEWRGRFNFRVSVK